MCIRVRVNIPILAQMLAPVFRIRTELRSALRNAVIDLAPESGRPPLTHAPPQMGQQQYRQQLPYSGQMPPPGMGGPQLDGPQQQGSGGQLWVQGDSQPQQRPGLEAQGQPTPAALQPPPQMPHAHGLDDILAQTQPTPAAPAGALPP